MSSEKRKQNQKNNKKFRILPESTGLGIAMLIVGFAEVMFLFFVMLLDMLPLKYILIMIICLILVDALIVYLATSPSKYGTRRIGTLVIIFVMLIVTLTGDYYIYCTTDTLNKISEKKDTWEYYKVITEADSMYQTVDDIYGQTVYVPSMNSKQLNEAKERLVTKAAVEYVEDPDIMTVASRVLHDGSAGTAAIASDGSITQKTTDGATTDGATTDGTKSESNLILISESQRQFIAKNTKGFGKKTKTIFKLKVKKRANDNSDAVNVTEDSFNVLISGLDSWGKIADGGLSDVNMVMTVNPNTRNILLTSIPRDSYIPLHSFGAKDKLTHSGIYGAEETKKTIEDFLGIKINYTIRVNFSLLVDIVDAIGGVDVYNDVDFYSHPKGWHYKKGDIHLAGHYALWFARERKSFLEGDMKRNENQQKVMEAILKKVTSSKVIMTRYTSILDAVEDEMSTDMTDNEIKKLAKMQLKDMKGWKIKRINITGSTGGAPCYSMGNRELSVVFPDEETVEKAKKKIHDTMYPVNNSEKKNSEEKDDAGSKKTE